MRLVNRLCTSLSVALVLAFSITSFGASQPTRIPALYNGGIVTIVPGNNANVVGLPVSVANPLYLVPGQNVNHVLSTAPGAPGYNPFWDIVVVTVLDGRDVSVDPFLSEGEILEAYLDGEVSLFDTGIIVLCQVTAP